MELFRFVPGLANWEGQTVNLWLLLYGVALHSAGMFISRGVRGLGWMFILAFLANPANIYRSSYIEAVFQPNAQMGLTFGLFHLIAAAYLFITERRAQATQPSAV